MIETRGDARLRALDATHNLLFTSAGGEDRHHDVWRQQREPQDSLDDAQAAQSPGGMALKPRSARSRVNRNFNARGQPMRVLALLLICTSLAGCGAVALPFRATADVARIVPVAGDAVAIPLDATGDAFDPPGH
jgi:hypothetical protein